MKFWMIGLLFLGSCKARTPERVHSNVDGASDAGTGDAPTTPDGEFNQPVFDENAVQEVDAKIVNNSDPACGFLAQLQTGELLKGSVPDDLHTDGIWVHIKFKGSLTPTECYDALPIQVVEMKKITDPTATPQPTN